MNVISKLKQVQTEKHETAYVVYRDLIHASLSADLDEKQQARLAKAVDDLGYTVERVEADVDVLRRHETHTAQSAHRDKIEKRLEAARADNEAAHRDYAETTARLEEKWRHASQILSELEREKARADDEHDRAEVLKREHWKLFGLPSPEQRAKSIHLYSAWTRTAEGATVRDVGIETLFNNPTAIDLGELTVVPLPGQPEDEVADLVAKVKRLQERRISLHSTLNTATLRANGYSFAVYPVLKADHDKLSAAKGGTCPAEWLGDEDGVDLSITELWRWPGYTEEQHQAAVDVVQELVAKRKPAKPKPDRFPGEDDARENRPFGDREVIPANIATR